MIKQCKKCENNFEDRSQAKTAKFCSKDCSGKYWYNINRAIYIDKAKKNYRLNREKRIKQISIRAKERKKTDIMFRLQLNLRKRFKIAFNNNQKTGSVTDNLGCTIEELRQHLETQFEPGMTWGNYGFRGWHMDHIKPLCTFDLTNLEQFKEACHFTNLKPLWWQDNLSKGGKVGQS